MGNKLIFCTSLIRKGTESRWKNWFEYYSELFPEFDLIAFNDGLIEGVFDPKWKVVQLAPHLGRESTWIFPGWKRSFAEALLYAIRAGYKRIIHIESDLYIRVKSRDRYCLFFNRNGYYAGFSKKYCMLDSSLQVLNNPLIVVELINYFRKEENQYKDEFAEDPISRMTDPENFYFLGERLEGPEEEDLKILENKKMEYFAQFNYDKWSKYLWE